MNSRRNDRDAESAAAALARHAAPEAAAPPGNTRPPTARAPSSAPSIAQLPILLTMGEVGALLRTSRKAVYAMAERRQLPGLTRIGRRLLVRRDDLLSWLDERRAASPGGTRR